MNRSRVLHVLKVCWPWLGVIAVGCWIAWPLWSATHSFYGALTGDNIQTAWFYDWTARSLRSGAGLETLSDFNYPTPYSRSVDFPAVMDAVLAAPMAWLFDWPRQFGAAQAMAVMVNALGFAWLARAMGARGLGILLAGGLGACCHPAWKALHMARMNAAWPGLAGAALGCCIEVFHASESSWKTRLPWVFGAALIGATAATTYPPFLLMLCPFGLLLVLHHARQTPPSRLALVVVAIGGGLALAWSELAGIAGSSRVSSDALDGLRCLSGPCPDPTLTVPLSRLLLVDPPLRSEQMLSGLTIGAWMLAPLSLLDRKRFWLCLGGLILTLCLAVLSLGPCAAWAPGQPYSPESWPLVGSFLRQSWCRVEVVHDYGRFSTIGALIAASLSAVGVEALGKRGRLPGHMVALGVAGLSLFLAGRYSLAQVTIPNRWAHVQTTSTAEFLASIEGPVAEIPFDPAVQYLSVLEAPGSPRANPLRRSDSRRVQDPFLSWLHALSRGDADATVPTMAQAHASGLSWVLFDSSRCSPPYPPPAACSASISKALEDLLGSPTSAGPGAKAWQIETQ
ncbi:MAG: hypothetical protein VX519_04765 [Myxococcota bacterium]|nr:hypothetical protein [Myxococcota bacterium]